MRNLLVILTLFVATAVFAKTNIYLDKSVYKKVPYSNIFINHGAMVKMVNYAPVNALIPQIERAFLKEYRRKIQLEDRGEAHITVITPPEFNGTPQTRGYGLHNLFTIGEIHARYRSYLPDVNFQVKCIGAREDRQEGKLVFYIVVDSPELFWIRGNLEKLFNKRAASAGIPYVFKSKKYYPHITIGFVKGDVFKYSKGMESCVRGLNLIVR